MAGLPPEELLIVEGQQLAEDLAAITAEDFEPFLQSGCSAEDLQGLLDTMPDLDSLL